MCGITGAVWSDPKKALGGDTLRKMVAVLEHRGPDGEGTYTDELHVRPPYEATPGVALGHRRLAIIDVAGGHQPMANEDRSVWVVFNGEIYNFPQLRRRLEGAGHRFATAGDTETIVHLYEDEGPGLLQHLNGMFALAIWDSNRKELFLARDRMGQKPLYWASTPEAMVFASELKALMLHPAVEKTLSPSSVAKYLLFDTVPSPHTILKNVYKLEPGTWLSYREGSYRIGRYWDIVYPSRRSRQPSGAAAREQFVELLKQSVRARLIADVPLGVFLSGGIDSSVITALMCDVAGSAKVKSFSVGFADASFDEPSFAALVAE